MERAIADLAGRQKGTIARRQMVRIGLPDPSIARWRQIGRLHRIYWGVYLYGHRHPGPLALEQGALLACGEDSVLSCYAAGYVQDLLPRHDGPVHLTTRRHREGPRGTKVHTSVLLDPGDITVRHGLRVTTVPRTLLDLAEFAEARDLERALETALAKRRTTDRQLRQLIDRSFGRTGASVLKALLDFRADDGYSRSRAEDLMRALLRRARLSQAKVNARVAGYEVDFSWPDHRFIVEIDSWAHHGGRDQFEYDRRKAADLQAAGWTVMRITFRQLDQEPEATAARIGAALALASA